LQPFTANLGILRNRYQVPADVLKSQNEPANYRRAQEKAHVEGMSQGVALALVAGNDAAAPEKIDGLQNTAPWNTLTANYVYNVGGASNLRSAWLMNPGMANVHLVHPKFDANAGISRVDKGEVFVAASGTDANASGNRWDVVTEFEWTFGIVVQDQRAVKRICNIDSNLSAMTTDLIQNIIRARHRHNVSGDYGWFLYCDPLVYTQLVIMAGDKANVRYSADNPYRIELPMIGDIIIRRMDALDTDETAVA
jgi:hypothetical protein